MARRFLAILVLLTVACAGEGVGTTSDRPVVITSTTVFADIVGSVAGDLAEVRSLVPVGGDPHVFQPRPSDAVAVTEADLVVDGGLGLTPWLPPLLSTRTGPVIDLGETVLVDEPLLVDEEGATDPHVWMVPTVVAEAYLPVITAALSALLPEAAEELASRSDAFAEVLVDLDAELRDALAVIPAERRLLVTSHDAYTYFAGAYELSVVGTVVGTNTEEQASARTVAALVDLVAELEIPTIFIETTVNPRVIERIARDTGARVGSPLYGDSLGPPGSGAETYADMLRTNAEHLVEGLG